MQIAIEPFLFPENEIQVKDETSSTFEDNMKMPVHRWYRYTAGFSASWVSKLINEEKRNGRCHIVDPFVGSGTVAVECQKNNVEGYGLESNPYVFRIASVKLKWNTLDPKEIVKVANDLLHTAKNVQTDISSYPSLIRRCFPDSTLYKLDALKRACLSMNKADEQDLMWFVITSILRTTSPVGTAQWQYIQPKKSKSKVLDPFDAFEKKVVEVCTDILALNASKSGHKVYILQEDARENVDIPDHWCDLVITSPPYANNYDYADAMRLEMSFWGDIDGYDGLRNVSSHLVRACTQHVSKLRNQAQEIIQSPLLAPIRDELQEKFDLLARERENHGGKKNYHLMIVAYFYDLARVFSMLNQKAKENCKMCFVIGDSAPYGIYIPVDEWLGRLAINAGFREYSFEKLRDRNTKWKNRKHRVPLKEGRLWINK